MFSIRPSALFVLILLGAVGCLEQNPSVIPSDGAANVPANAILRYTYTGPENLSQDDVVQANPRIAVCAKPETSTAEGQGADNQKSQNSNDGQTQTSDGKATQANSTGSSGETPIAVWVSPPRNLQLKRTWKDGTVETLKDTVATEVLIIPKPGKGRTPPLPPATEICFNADEIKLESGVLVPAVSTRFTTEETSNFVFGSSATVQEHYYPNIKKFLPEENAFDPENMSSLASVAWKFAGNGRAPKHINPEKLNAGSLLCMANEKTKKLTERSGANCLEAITVSNKGLAFVVYTDQKTKEKEEKEGKKAVLTANFDTFLIYGPSVFTKEKGTFQLDLGKNIQTNKQIPDLVVQTIESAKDSEELKKRQLLLDAALRDRLAEAGMFNASFILIEDDTQEDKT